MANDVKNLSGPELRKNRDGHRAQGGDCEVCDHPVRAVLTDNGHLVPMADSPVLNKTGQILHPFPELSVRDLFFIDKADGPGVGKPPAAVMDHPLDCNLRINGLTHFIPFSSAIL